jgi:hypothetical protein
LPNKILWYLLILSPKITENFRKKIVLIGGGSSSLLCAYFLSEKYDVDIYEKGAAIGKKYLVAGKGGFNLSHASSGKEMIQKYTPNGFLDQAITAFPPDTLRKWYAELGIPTFVGSSHRIFPEKGITPATVLRTIKTALVKKGVKIHTHHAFVGFSENHLPLLQNSKETTEIQADHFIFSLGGSSWSVTGSDGSWLTHFRKIGIQTTPFQAANCGLNITWPDEFRKFHSGKPLKNIAVRFTEKIQKGEALITEYGLEGNAIYPLASAIGRNLTDTHPSSIELDLKPMLTEEQVISKIQHSQPGNFAKKLQLPSVVIALMKMVSSPGELLQLEQFAHYLKNLPLPVTSLRPIEEAISTTGGIATTELHPDFSLKKHPHLSCIGEMVDWDAPTGGYLLHACFSMAFWKAKNLLKG